MAYEGQAGLSKSSKKTKKKRSASTTGSSYTGYTAAELAALQQRSAPSVMDRAFAAAKAAPRNASTQRARLGGAGASHTPEAMSKFMQMERNFTNRTYTPPGGYTPGPGKGLMSILNGMLPKFQAAPIAAPAVTPAEPDYLGMQLAALGSGPEKSHYLRPFDEAQQRVTTAYGEAVPQIAKAYDDLRTQLAAGQQAFGAEQAQIAAEQQAHSTQLADRVRTLQGPPAQDLVTQAGGNAAPSLVAGVQAQALQNEANLADAQRRQASFLENLARTSEQSGAARLSDTHVAQEAALGNAKVNQNTLLGQLDMQRAAAEQRYGADVRSHGLQRVGVMQNYLQQQREAEKEAERAQAAEAKEAERQLKEQDKLQRRVGGTGAVFGSFARQNDHLRRRYPKHFKAVGELIGIDYEPGELGRASAHAVVDANLDAFTGPDAVERYGAALKPERLHELIDLYYSQEEGLMLPFLQMAS